MRCNHLWIYSITNSSAEAANPLSLMALQDFILFPYNCSLKQYFHLSQKNHISSKIKQRISYIKEQRCKYNWCDKTGSYRNVNFCILFVSTYIHCVSTSLIVLVVANTIAFLNVCYGMLVPSDAQKHCQGVSEKNAFSSCKLSKYINNVY